MTAVFLAYAHANRDLASRIVGGLKAAGVDVWWDEDMPGVDWRQAIERQIAQVGAVVALWTPASKDSASVKDAARVALPAGKLVSATAGAAPPFPYGSADAAALDGWTGADGHAGWTQLVETIRARVNTGGGGANTSAGLTKNETPPVNSFGGSTKPETTSSQTETLAGLGQTSGAQGPQIPTGGAGPEKKRDAQKEAAEALSRWQQQNKETLLGVGVRRLLAAGLAFAGVMVGLGEFHSPPLHPSGVLMVPLGMLALAGFLWKGWR